MGCIHLLVVATAFTVMLIDGYGLIGIAVVAPLLQREWHFGKSAFGKLFSTPPAR